MKLDSAIDLEKVDVVQVSVNGVFAVLGSIDDALNDVSIGNDVQGKLFAPSEGTPISTLIFPLGLPNHVVGRVSEDAVLLEKRSLKIGCLGWLAPHLHRTETQHPVFGATRCLVQCPVLPSSVRCTKSPSTGWWGAMSVQVRCRYKCGAGVVQIETPVPGPFMFSFQILNKYLHRVEDWNGTMHHRFLNGW